MKKLLITTLVSLAIAAPAFANNHKTAAVPASGLVDSSGKAVTTEGNQPVAVAPAEAPAADVAMKKAPEKKAKHVKKAHKKHKAAAKAAPAAEAPAEAK